MYDANNEHRTSLTTRIMENRWFWNCNIYSRSRKFIIITSRMRCMWPLRTKLRSVLFKSINVVNINLTAETRQHCQHIWEFFTFLILKMCTICRGTSQSCDTNVRTMSLLFYINSHISLANQSIESMNHSTGNYIVFIW